MKQTPYFKAQKMPSAGPVQPVRPASAIQTHGCKSADCRNVRPGVRQSASPLVQNTSSDIHAGLNSPRPTKRIVSGIQAMPGVNRPSTARTFAVVNSKASTYAVQAPIHSGGHSQQIKATINGTRQVAGSIELSSASAGKVYLSNLRVDQQHRRRGVASKLIEAALATARRQGFKAATLEARPSDNGVTQQSLVAMYRRQGFRNVGKSSRGCPMMERRLFS